MSEGSFRSPHLLKLRRDVDRHWEVFSAEGRDIRKVDQEMRNTLGLLLGRLILDKICLDYYSSSRATLRTY